MTTTTTLYEQLGGAPAIDKAVDIFYEKMIRDSRVKHFFEGTDMKAQAAKQKAFLRFVTGGPNKYTGKNMRDAHAHLIPKGLNDSHVDVVIEHLGATLKELGVGDAQIQQVAALANSVRGDVLGRTAPQG